VLKNPALINSIYQAHAHISSSSKLSGAVSFDSSIRVIPASTSIAAILGADSHQAALA
jgi:hypothetical protein